MLRLRGEGRFALLAASLSMTMGRWWLSETWRGWRSKVPLSWCSSRFVLGLLCRWGATARYFRAAGQPGAAVPTFVGRWTLKIPTLTLRSAWRQNGVHSIFSSSGHEWWFDFSCPVMDTPERNRTKRIGLHKLFSAENAKS